MRVAITQRIEACGLRVSFFEFFEVDDIATLVEGGYEVKPGIEFQIMDSEGSFDAAGAWNEALKQCREILVESVIASTDVSSITINSALSTSIPTQYFELAAATRLGRVVESILYEFGSTGGVIAMLDGGIDEVRLCEPKAVFDYVFRSFLVPWDRLGNCALVW